MKCSIFQKVCYALNTVLQLVGLVFLADGIYACVKTTQPVSSAVIAIIVIGAVLLVVGLIGDKGSGYDSHDKDTFRSLKWLAVYFFCLFAVATALALFGILCLIAKESVRTLVLTEVPQLLVIFKDLMPDRIPDDDAVIAFCDANLSTIGYVSLGIGVLLVFGMIMAGYRMGYKLFYGSIGIGNFIIFLAGAALVALCIYCFAALKLGSILLAVIGGTGGLLVVVSVWGWSAWGCKNKCCMCTAGILLILVTAMIVLLTVVLIAFLPSFMQLVDQACSDPAAASSCLSFFSFFANATVYPSPNVTVAVAAFEQTMAENPRLIGFSGAISAIIGVWMVVSSFMTTGTMPKRVDKADAAKAKRAGRSASGLVSTPPAPPAPRASSTTTVTPARPPPALTLPATSSAAKSTTSTRQQVAAAPSASSVSAPPPPLAQPSAPFLSPPPYPAETPVVAYPGAAYDYPAPQSVDPSYYAGYQQAPASSGYYGVGAYGAQYGTAAAPATAPAPPSAPQYSGYFGHSAPIPQYPYGGDQRGYGDYAAPQPGYSY